MKLLDWLRSRQNPAPHTFHGGLHVPGHKALSTGQPSRELPLAEHYCLSLRQRNGLLQTALVAEGERVLRGQTLTRENGAGSVPRHAPTSGTIIAISEHDDIHPLHQRAPAILIRPDGRDESAPALPALDWQHTAPDLLLKRIHDCGISGMGGAGFPTARKLKHQNRTLVVNAAECEPYITCDDMQIRECAAEIVKGAQITAHIIGADTIHFGIEDDKPQAIAALERAIAQAQDPRIKITTVPTRYPSGNSRQLFELLLGIRVPTDRHAAEYGLVCHNSATIKAIHDAVILGLPLTERYVTLTGEALARPQVVRARFGTPLDWLIAQAGGANQHARHIIGGPMMGHEQHALAAGIKKTTNCVLLLPALPAPQEDNCIRCARCSDACPMELLPQQLYWYSRNGHSERLKQYRLFDCIECGICASVCPATIPLVDYYRHSKAAIREETRKQAAAEHAKARHEAREARLAREAAEREAKMAAKRAALQQRTAPPPAEPEITSNEPLPPRGRGWGEGKQAEGLSEQAGTSPHSEPAEAPANNLPLSPTLGERSRGEGVTKTTKAPENTAFNPTESAPASPDKSDAIAAAKARAAARKAARQQQIAEKGTDEPLPPRGRGWGEGKQAKGLSETTNAPALPPAEPAATQQTPPEPPVSTNATHPGNQPAAQEDPLAAAKARAAARKAARQQQIAEKSTDEPLPPRGRGWGEGKQAKGLSETTNAPALPPAEPAATQNLPELPVSTNATHPDNQPAAQEDPLAAAKARAAARKAARQQQIAEKSTDEPLPPRGRGWGEGKQAEGLSETTSEPTLPPAEPAATQNLPELPVSTNAT
ncbi:MAG: electron transport complex subunit RsxC, partial [Cardiobacteriaceae bacterium]|nr:electron transport complex subunit RsxC [Cardiobacteriaceae bacterium]